MPNRIAAPAALTLALLIAAPLPTTARADALADGIAALAPAVQDVKVAGAWEKDGGKGVYRVVVARQAGAAPATRLFVQWIATAADGTESVARTIEIPELAALNLGVSDLTAESDPDGLSVFVHVIEGGQVSDQSYELFVDTDGTYRFGPASN